MNRASLLKLADFYQENAIRIVRLKAIDGISQSDAALAANYFTIAKALRRETNNG